MSLNQWRQQGAYSASATSPRKILLQTAPQEIGSALLCEAEHFMDHAAEHQASMFLQRSSATWSSPAWTVVGFYYWAFYCALSFSRLIGRTTWYLDRDAAKALGTLAGIAGIGAGTFGLTCGPRTGVMSREVVLQRKKARLHDCVWTALFQQLGAHTSPATAVTANQLEHRLYLSFKRAASQLGGSWPSELRNAVNYRPGHGYGEVLQMSRLDITNHVRATAKLTPDQLVNNIESELARAARLLISTTFALNMICRELHADLLDRNQLDSRWSQARTRFLSKHGAGAEAWPC
jgi:hypothetical protein